MTKTQLANRLAEDPKLDRIIKSIKNSPQYQREMSKVRRERMINEAIKRYDRRNLHRQRIKDIDNNYYNENYIFNEISLTANPVTNFGVYYPTGKLYELYHSRLKGKHSKKSSIKFVKNPLDIEGANKNRQRIERRIRLFNSIQRQKYKEEQEKKEEQKNKDNETILKKAEKGIKDTVSKNIGNKGRIVNTINKAGTTVIIDKDALDRTAKAVTDIKSKDKSIKDKATSVGKATSRVAMDTIAGNATIKAAKAAARKKPSLATTFILGSSNLRTGKKEKKENKKIEKQLKKIKKKEKIKGFLEALYDFDIITLEEYQFLEGYYDAILNETI